MKARSAARDALREATHDVHMRLHRHPSFAQLAEGTIDLKGYSLLMARLYGFHAPLEAALVTGLQRLPSNRAFMTVEMGRRLRVHRLREDLQALHMSEIQIEALPLMATQLPMNSWGQFAGALYVREGATLGGRVLAKGLDRVLGSGHFLGRSFLAGDAEEKALWQTCCFMIDEVAADGHFDDTIASALATFDALETWLAEDNFV
jgi:heme oxygenase (biliverdin-IX-beta and delta-forming)